MLKPVSELTQTETYLLIIYIKDKLSYFSFLHIVGHFTLIGAHLSKTEMVPEDILMIAICK